MGLLSNLFSGKQKPAAVKKDNLTVSGGGYDLPISGGTVPANWPINFWQTGRDPIRRGGTATVHACVDAYSQTIATVPGYHNRYNLAGEKTRITTSAASRLLHRPNSYQTRSDFFYNAVKSLLLNGNAYVLGIRNERNEIAEAHLLTPRSTQPYVEPETRSVFYAAGDNPLVGDIEAMIPARDICHFRLYTPRHPLIGVSPITNAAETIAANSAITAHQATFFDNMSRPSGLLSTDLQLTKDQMSQLREAWNEQSQGLNTGGVPILGSGIKWDPMSISSQDAQLVEAFNMTVEDIARAFRVPLPLVNADRNNTYNSIEQLISYWLSGGLGFILDHVENNLDRFFGLPQTERTEFDIDVLLRTDFQARIEGYSKGIQNGLFTPNEARARMAGLPSVEFGDKPIVQQQMVPLGWMEGQPPPPQPGQPQPPDDDLSDEERTGAQVVFLKKVMNDG